MRRTLIRLALVLSFVTALPTFCLAQGATFIPNTAYLNFPSTRVTRTLEQSVIVRNTDRVRSLHGHAYLTSTGVYEIAGGDSIMLAPGAEDTIRIRFAPTSATTFRDSLRFATDGDPASNAMIVYLIGVGRAASDTLPRVAYFTQLSTTASTDSFSVINFWLVNLSDSGTYVTGHITRPHTPFSLETQDTTFRIAAFDTAFFPIRFSTANYGTYRDSIFVLTSADTTHIRKISITGIAQTPITPVISVYNIEFDTVMRDSTVSRTFTIRNETVENRALIYSIKSLKSPYSVAPAITNDTLQRGEERTIAVSFTPIAAGMYRDTLVVTTNANAPRTRFIIPLRAVVPSSASVTEEASSSTLALSLQTDGVWVSSAVPQAAELTIVDLLGRIALRESLFLAADGQHLTFPTLPSGTYIVLLSSGEQRAVFKLQR